MNKYDVIITLANWRQDSGLWEGHKITIIHNSTKLPNNVFHMKEGQDTGDDLYELLKQVVPSQRPVSSDVYNARLNRMQRTLKTLRAQLTEFDDDDEIIEAYNLQAVKESPVPFTGTRVCVLCFDSDLPHVADTMKRFRSEFYPMLMSDVNEQTGTREPLGYDNFEWFTRVEQLEKFRYN
jgi:hypothetical protein